MINKNFIHWIFISALLWCVIVAILYSYHWLVDDYVFAATIAFFAWYIGFGFECILNRAPKDGVVMPFYYLWQDIQTNLPFYGWGYRLKLTNGDEQWAHNFPGLTHFAWTHIAVPALLYFGILVLLGVK